MSTTIDQRVVEMRFDNKQFESGVSTTMSALDKLKQSLNFKGASQGFEDINAAAKSVNMSGLGSAVETVHAKFSALEVMGVTALANITNSALNAGKKMISALTLDPITSGFQEYETQINAVQTILANTSSKGSTIDDVNRALEELNLYADKTIYNFTEMTRNIGTFTAAGIDLETSTQAIQGIANLAAVSGSTSQQASTAMYQLSQALAAGSVKLMDWNSVVNAGMGGEVFQNALIRTASLMEGISEETFRAEVIGESFRESLKDGWLTAEVLTKTLNTFTTSGVNEYLAEQSNTTVTAIEKMREQALAADDVEAAYREMAKTLAQNSKLSEDQIFEYLNMSTVAEDAATKVKTFTQLWDVLKESAQSGWSQTWKTIVGDFEEAKSLLTPLADFLTTAINSFSNARNFLIEGAFDLAAPWAAIMEKIDSAGLGRMKELAENVAEVTENLEYFQKIVTEVWLGRWNTSDTGRFEMLEAAGYDHRVVQDLVNKGYQYNLTMEDVVASHKKFGLTLTETSETVKSVEDIFASLTDEQLRNAGLTEDEIRLYRDLAAEAKRTERSMSELIDEMSKNDGRTMLIEAFKNAGKGLVTIFTAAKDAWVEIFPPMSVVTLYNIIKGIKDFSENLLVGDDTAEKLKRTLKGLFAIIDIIATIAGGALKIALEVVVELLKYFNLDILDVTAGIGDAIVGFRDWIDSLFDVKGIVEALGPLLESAIKAVKDWFTSLKDSEAFKSFSRNVAEAKNAVLEWFGSLDAASIFEKFKSRLATAKEAVVEWFTNLKDMSPEEIAQNIVNGVGAVITRIGEMFSQLKDFVMGKVKDVPDGILSGFIEGLRDGAVKVGQVIVEIGKILVEKIKDYLGIHSPSTVFFAIGGFIISGLVGGLLAGSGDVWQAIKDIGAKCVEYISAIDFGAIFAVAITAGMVAVGWKVSNALEAFASPFEGIGDILENAAETVEVFNKSLKKLTGSLNFAIKMEAIKSLAVAIGILVAAVIALTFFDPVELLKSVGVMAAIGVVLGVLAFALDKFKISTVDMGKFSLFLLSLGASMLLLAWVLKIASSIPEEAFWVAVGGTAALGVVVAGLMLATRLAGNNLGKIGTTILAISAAMVLLVAAAKIISGMTWDEFELAAKGIGGLAAVVAGLMLAVRLAGNGIDKAGSAILGIAAAMLILIVTAKLIAHMEWGELGKAAVGLVGLGGIVTGLMAATKLAGNDLGKIGTTILAISAAMLLLTITAKIIADMEWEELGKAAVGLAGLGGIVTGLIAATKLAGNNLAKIGATMLAISVAIALLAGVAALLGLMDLTSLAKGVGAVAILGSIMAGLIYVTKYAEACKGNIIAITVAIGVMAAAVAVLSFIDGTKLAGATAALAALMAVFGGIIALTKFATGSMSTLIVMTVAVGALAGIVALMTKLDTKKAIEASASLSLLLVALSASLVLLSFAGKSSVEALGGIIALTALAVPLLAFIGVLALMQNVENAMANATVLSLLTSVLTVVLGGLTIIGNFAVAALSGVLALTSLAVPLLAFIGELALMQNIQNAAENATILSAFVTTMTIVLAALTLIGAVATLALSGVLALTALAVPLLAFIGELALLNYVPNAQANADLLSGFMTSMADVLVKVGIVAPLAVVGVGAIASLSAVMTAIGVLAVGVGALMTKFPELQEFLNKGIPILEQLANGVGSLLGNLIGGFIGGVATSIANTLPQIGLCLSQFMINAMPFVNLIKLVDDSVLTGIGILAGAILIFTAADLISGIASFAQGGSSFADLGTELSQFLINAAPFIAGASMIKAEVMEGVKAIAETILILTAADVLNGLSSWFTGGSSLSEFGAQLPQLGMDLNSFATNLGTFDDSHVTTITCASDAIKVLADSAATIPNEGGLWASIVGDNGIAAFSNSLPKLGTDLRNFVVNLGTFNESQVATVTCATDAIKSLASAASDIPNEGGLWASIVGDNGLSAFADHLPGLGTNISAFVENLGTFTEAQVSSVTCSVDAVKAFTGLADADLKGAAKNIDGFGDKVVDFAGDMTTFCDDMPSGNKVSTALTNLGRILDAIADIKSSDASVASKFTDALKKIGKDGVKKFVEAFTSSSSKTDVKKAASDLMGEAVKGIEKKGDTLNTAIGEVVKAAAASVKDYYESFYSAGSYLVDGFAAGISENDFKAAATAAAMATAALEAAEEALDENSPSKEFYKVGAFAGQGFVNALGDYASASYKAGSEMASTSKDGLRDALNQTSEILRSDIDITPTIKPVLDLSDVKSGAANIGNMLNLNPSVGVSSNISAINSMMNGRVQNGGNGDIVSAINRLHDGFDKVGNTTYSIEGITYDDGSNIADAVRTLVRAAKVERRN